MTNQEDLTLKDIPGITSAPVMPSEVASKAIKDTTRAYAFPLMAALQALAPSAATVGTATKWVAGAAVVATMASCGDKDKDPNPEEIPLTAEQKLFASAFDPTNQKLIDKEWVKPSILDGKPVVTVPVSPVPNNTNFTEAFKGFMDIEIRLIDAKAGTYSITPIINKSSVEKIIEKGKELVPNKDSYGMSLVCDAINGDIKRSLTTGVEILDKPDVNPNVRAPHIAQLPERFTIDEFRKYYTNGTTLVKTFDMSKSESFRMIMDLATIGQKFDTVVYPVNPSSDALSVVQN